MKNFLNFFKTQVATRFELIFLLIATCIIIAIGGIALAVYFFGRLIFNFFKQMFSKQPKVEILNDVQIIKNETVDGVEYIITRQDEEKI